MSELAARARAGRRRRGLGWWTCLDLGGPRAAEKICTLWDRGGGGGGGENRGATGPAEKQVSAGVEQRNLPSKKGAQRAAGNGQLAGVPAWRHQSQGSNEIRPAEDPSLASPFDLSLLLNPALMGMVGVHYPVPLFLGKGVRCGLCSPSVEAKNPTNLYPLYPESSAPFSRS